MPAVRLLIAAALFMLLGNKNGCHGSPVWDYEKNNPSKLPILYQKWCNSRSQSPIKLAYSGATYDTDLPVYSLSEQSITGLKYQVYNDGHKIGVIFSSVMPNVTVPGHPGSCYRPQSAHWHWGSSDTVGSEHWLEGQQYPLEGHIVMWNCMLYSSYSEALDGNGGLAVLGVVFEPDSSLSVASLSPGLGSVMNLMTNSSMIQRCEGCANETFVPPTVDINAFSLNDILPAERSQYYLYSGSLTTPDCRENVMWTVYTQSIKVPREFLTGLRNLKFAHGEPMVNNFRPPLALNPPDPFGSRRMVVRSFNVNLVPRTAIWHRGHPTVVALGVAAVLGMLRSRISSMTT